MLEWAERCVGCALSTKVKWWQRETIHMLFSKARLARLVEHLVYIQDAWAQYLAIIIRLERSEHGASTHYHLFSWLSCFLGIP